MRDGIDGSFVENVFELMFLRKLSDYRILDTSVHIYVTFMLLNLSYLNQF